MFQTQYNRVKHTRLPEINSGEILVETAGYISTEKRINNMMLAGQRLVESRRTQYDLEGDYDNEDIDIDPTRDPGYDLADATQDMLALEQKAESQKAGEKTSPQSDKVEQKAAVESTE